MEQYQESVVLVTIITGAISGPLGQLVIEMLKVCGLKRRKLIRPVAALVCTAIAAGLLCAQGSFTWPVAAISGLLAWAAAETGHRALTKKDPVEEGVPPPT